MVPRRRLLSAIGARYIIGLLGTLFVAVAVGFAIVESDHPHYHVNILVLLMMMIVVPGVILVYGAYWLARDDIDPDFYPRIAGWCLAGFGVMAFLLVVYHLQPGESVSMRSTPILTAHASVAGLGVGINDGQCENADVRTRNSQPATRTLSGVHG
ncbi:hypothetical protein [Natrinema halophilum]|uniref:hypothetical protein n=1 Tax=Natrinema halophilum TaxID=1699371 RepID=UPI003CCDAE17